MGILLYIIIIIIIKSNTYEEIELYQIERKVQICFGAIELMEKEKNRNSFYF